MLTRYAGLLFLVGMAMVTAGGAAEPASRVPATQRSTVGMIAPSAQQAVPLSVGDSVPELSLKTADGAWVNLRESLARQPAVLLFYRGSWCHFCMRELSGMEGIKDELAAAGYQLIAISPDKPDKLRKTVADDQLSYPLLSDSEAKAIRAFGLAFLASPEQFEMLERASGQAHHAIPVPTVYIVGTDGKIKFAYSNPDFKVRLSPSKVLDAVKAIRQ